MSSSLVDYVNGVYNDNGRAVLVDQPTALGIGSTGPKTVAEAIRLYGDKRYNLQEGNAVQYFVGEPMCNVSFPGFDGRMECMYGGDVPYVIGSDINAIGYGTWGPYRMGRVGVAVPLHYTSGGRIIFWGYGIDSGASSNLLY